MAYLPKKEVVIIVPLYNKNMTEKEEYSFFRMVDVFNDRDICIVCPESINGYAKELSNTHEHISISLFSDTNFKGVLEYNRLLMSLEFYQRFINYKYMLICQLDVYVFKDELNYWIDKDFDNIGAPIFEFVDSKPTLKMRKKGNNGGFCLRKITTCISVLSSIKNRYYKIATILKVKDVENSLFWNLFRLIRDGLIFNYNIKYLRPIINEDIFWSIIVPLENHSFKVCDPKESMYFSFDSNPRLLYEKCNYKIPMAIHAWWKYDIDFVKSLINNKSN